MIVRRKGKFLKFFLSFLKYLVTFLYGFLLVYLNKKCQSFHLWLTNDSTTSLIKLIIIFILPEYLIAYIWNKYIDREHS